MPLCLCTACGLPAESPITTLPCEECLASLLVSPEICRYCLGLDCSPEKCQRPWMQVEGDEGIRRFDTITAAYLSIGPGASVLKSWKKSGSPALQRILTQGVTEAVRTVTGHPLILIPVPQSATRNWQLNGGSVRRLCSMIRAGIPNLQVLDLLEVDHSSETNQARMRGDGRYRREARFRLKPSEKRRVEIKISSDLRDPEILIVDDFLTSGATIRSAIEVTRLAFEELGLFSGRRTRIGAFVLGFRPSLNYER